jgi:hypothetical protein
MRIKMLEAAVQPFKVVCQTRPILTERLPSEVAFMPESPTFKSAAATYFVHNLRGTLPSSPDRSTELHVVSRRTCHHRLATSPERAPSEVATLESLPFSSDCGGDLLWLYPTCDARPCRRKAGLSVLVAVIAMHESIKSSTGYKDEPRTSCGSVAVSIGRIEKI